MSPLATSTNYASSASKLLVVHYEEYQPNTFITFSTISEETGGLGPPLTQLNPENGCKMASLSVCICSNKLNNDE